MRCSMLITTDNGLEYVLLNELRELVEELRVVRVFSGRLLLECNVRSLVDVLRSRIANNVYYVLGFFEGVKGLDDVYRSVKSLDFSSIVKPCESFAIRPERIGEHTFTSIDIARVAGQAVIDSYLEAKGIRLRVDLDRPDVEVYVELNDDKLFVALKLTRSSLHKRGYRVFSHPASLKTTIASAMLRIAGWRREEGLLDPMCGGATLLIEAGLIEKGVECLCFKKAELLGNPVVSRLDPSFSSALERVCSRVLEPLHLAILGIEKNPVYAEGGVVNAKCAGVDDVVKIVVGDCRKVLRKGIDWVFRELGAEPRVAVFNPPYGVRMRGAESMAKLYASTLRALEEAGFERIVFITSAVGSAESALRKLRALRKVERLYTIHGTLPSFIYRLELA